MAPAFAGVSSSVQMTLKNRVLDMMPIALVIGLVTLFAAYCLVAYIISEPMPREAPTSQQASHSTPAVASVAPRG